MHFNFNSHPAVLHQNFNKSPNFHQLPTSPNQNHFQSFPVAQFSAPVAAAVASPSPISPHPFANSPHSPHPPHPPHPHVSNNGTVTYTINIHISPELLKNHRILLNIILRPTAFNQLSSQPITQTKYININSNGRNQPQPVSCPICGSFHARQY